MAEWSKAWVCDRSLAGIAVSNPAGGGHGCLSLVSVVCCQVEVSVTGRSLVQRGPAECGVSVCVCDLKNLNNETAYARMGAFEPQKKTMHRIFIKFIRDVLYKKLSSKRVFRGNGVTNSHSLP